MRAISEALLEKYLDRKRKRPLKILDAGCGPGTALIYLSQFGEVIGVDISDEALILAKKRGKVIKGDVSTLPFKDKTFDLVICIDLLYHKWVNTERAISEITRVLKPEGIFLLREPAFNWFRSSEDIASQTAHRFTTNEIKNLLAPSFEILRLTYINFFLFPLAFLKRLPEVIGIKKKRGVSDASNMSPLLNNLFFLILRIESQLVTNLNFPFGTSVACVAKKK